MATKNVKKEKDLTQGSDPFAAIAESSDKTAAPQKPARAIKVIKAAKTSASIASETAKAPISTSKSSSRAKRRVRRDRKTCGRRSGGAGASDDAAKNRG